jgi:hypothetical protein
VGAKYIPFARPAGRQENERRCGYDRRGPRARARGAVRARLSRPATRRRRKVSLEHSLATRTRGRRARAAHARSDGAGERLLAYPCVCTRSCSARAGLPCAR